MSRALGKPSTWAPSCWLLFGLSLTTVLAVAITYTLEAWS